MRPSVFSKRIWTTIIFMTVGFCVFPQTREFQNFLNLFEKAETPFETMPFSSVDRGCGRQQETWFGGWLENYKSQNRMDEETLWRFIITDSSELFRYNQMWEWQEDEDGNRIWGPICRYTRTAFIPQVKFEPIDGLFPVIYYERRWWIDTSRFVLAIFDFEGKMLAREIVYVWDMFDFDVDTTDGHFAGTATSRRHDYVIISNWEIDATIFENLSFERRTRRRRGYSDRRSSSISNYLETTTENFVFCRKANGFLRSIQRVEVELDSILMVSIYLEEILEEEP